MHCGSPKGPILDCEPKAFREASGIEQSSRRFRLFSSHASVIPVTIRAPALAQFPFERRLRAEGGPPQNCIIFDTSSKQDLDLLTAQRLSGQPLARRLFSKKEVAFNFKRAVRLDWLNQSICRYYTPLGFGRSIGVRLWQHRCWFREHRRRLRFQSWWWRQYCCRFGFGRLSGSRRHRRS